MIKHSALLSLLRQNCLASVEAGMPLTLGHIATLASLLKICESGVVALEQYHAVTQAKDRTIPDNIVPFPERPASAPPSGEAS